MLRQRQYQERAERRSLLLPASPSPSRTPSPLELQARRLPAAAAHPDDALPSRAAALARSPSPAPDPPLLPWSLYPPRGRFYGTTLPPVQGHGAHTRSPPPPGLR